MHSALAAPGDKQTQLPASQMIRLEQIKQDVTTVKTTVRVKKLWLTKCKNIKLSFKDFVSF